MGEKISKSLPILPLKDVVIFPHIYVPLNVGRDFSKKAINEGKKHFNSYIITCLQRDSNLETVSKVNDLYKVGTLCQIIKIENSSSSNYKVLVQGLKRVELKNTSFKNEIMTEYTELPELDFSIKEEKNKAIYDLILKDLIYIVDRGFVSDSLIPEDRLDVPIDTCYLLMSLLQKSQDNQIILECNNAYKIVENTYKLVSKQRKYFEIKENIVEKAKDQMSQGQKEYFLKEQLKAIKKELGDDKEIEVSSYEKKLDKIKPYISVSSYDEISKQIKKIESSTQESLEISVIKNYLDLVFDLPWSEQTEDRLDISESKLILDQDHYGLDEVKERILELLAIRKLNSKTKGQIICFVGPPGVGKTSFAKSIARAMGRECVRISLGGVKDEAEIRGHRRCIKDADLCTENGLKKIEEITIEDKVLTGENTFEQVLNVFKQETDKTIIIKTQNGRILEGAKNHPILAYDNTFKRLDELKVSDVVYCKNFNDLDSSIDFISGIIVKEEKTICYDIALAKTHTFWSNGFISHNTYVGSMPGKIINGMKQAKTVNPVFILDEIDKLSNDFRGDPSSALLEVLDPEQNNTFRDHYLNIDYDLSKVLFIATANNGSAIPPALKDRMETITISGYCEEEKIEIAKQFLISKNMKECGLTDKDVSFKDTGLKSIIRNYTAEYGVRELSRQINKVCGKIAKIIAEGKKDKKIVITDKNLKDYLGVDKFSNTEDIKNGVGIVTGLAWTAYGGETLKIESILLKEKGTVILTGSLGEVMKESSSLAISLIKGSAKKWEIDLSIFDENRIHIHIPAGATPKEGPSAGVGLFSSILSLLLNKKVKDSLAMTGEITLSGKVLPVGGIKEKVLAAIRSDIKTVLLPKENKKDFDSIPEKLREKISVKYITSVSDLLKEIF